MLRSVKYVQILIFSSSLLCMYNCFAQTVKLQKAPANIVVNGNAKEWSDDLFYSNKKANVNYIICYDNDNIYLVLKTKDTIRQSSILGAGLTWAINTEGKEKSDYAITFPASGPEDKGEYLGLDPEETQVKIALTKHRKIDVKNFKDITDEQLSPLNAYGIQIAMKYNQGFLIYEAAIPITLFNKDAGTGKEWAFNIKINGLKRTFKPLAIIIGRTPPGADPPVGNSKPADLNRSSTVFIPSSANAVPPDEQLTPSVNFWVKFAW